MTSRHSPAQGLGPILLSNRDLSVQSEILVSPVSRKMFQKSGSWIGRTPRGSCNRTLLRRVLRRVLRRFSSSKCFLEG